MIHIKRYELFEGMNNLTIEQSDWLENICSNKTEWSINPNTGLVDVNGNFDCSSLNIKDFKGIRFGTIKGDFFCGDNELTSLDGSPRYVKGKFSCSGNKGITTLEGGPLKVGVGFYCVNNSITNLVGSPIMVGDGYFNCSNNMITSLVGSPKNFEGDFTCSNNLIENFIGTPEKLNFLDFRKNNIISLEGFPKIKNNFYPDSNPISENTIKMIASKMYDGFDYYTTISILKNEIPKKDWDLLEKSKLSTELVKGASALKRFGIFKEEK